MLTWVWAVSWWKVPVQSEEGVLGGVVVGVLGEDVGWGWGGVGGGVAELELLVVGRRRRTVASAPVMLRFWMLMACQGSAKVRAGVARMVLA